MQKKARKQNNKRKSERKRDTSEMKGPSEMLLSRYTHSWWCLFLSPLQHFLFCLSARFLVFCCFFLFFHASTSSLNKQKKLNAKRKQNLILFDTHFQFQFTVTDVLLLPETLPDFPKCIGVCGTIAKFSVSRKLFSVTFLFIFFFVLFPFLYPRMLVLLLLLSRHLPKWKCAFCLSVLGNGK